MNQQITDHPDFARILQVVAEQDDDADNGLDLDKSYNAEESKAEMQRMFGHLVDPKSLYDAAHNRTRGAMATLLPALILGMADPVSAFSALWGDAFLAGVRFQQAGGHVEPESTDTPEA